MISIAVTNELSCVSPVHFHVLSLTDSVAPSLCLQIILRVPVAVVDDHGVGGSKIDSNTSSTCGEKVHKGVFRLGVESVDTSLAVAAFDATIQTLKIGE